MTSRKGMQAFTWKTVYLSLIINSSKQLPQCILCIILGSFFIKLIIFNEQFNVITQSAKGANYENLIWSYVVCVVSLNIGSLTHISTCGSFWCYYSPFLPCMYNVCTCSERRKQIESGEGETYQKSWKEKKGYGYTMYVWLCKQKWR